MSEADIKEFWDKQAEVHKASDLATAPDHIYRELEINAIMPEIRGTQILDVGCGNGYSTLRFAAHHNRKFFLGIDYSEKMIEQASAELALIHGYVKGEELENINFKVEDVRDVKAIPGFFDTIISERCLINLTSWDEQAAVLLKLIKKLAEGGRLILVENFTDGLKNLNDLRARFDLPEIKVRWHNRYLDKDKFEDFCRSNHLRVPHCSNIGNFYYIVSRVIYAELARAEGNEPDYNHPINRIAAKLPNLGMYSYSPNMMYVLERV